MSISLNNLEEAEELYNEIKSQNLKLDLTRGKPHSDQLDLSNNLLHIKDSEMLHSGIDTRNYGEIMGLEACRQLGAKILDCPIENVIAGGNSSLTLMSQYLSSLYFHGTGHSGPWSTKERVSFLCPAPGYDRHFKLCEEFGINMISVPLTGSGPDINFIEKIVDQDKSVKGIWCVPKHSNPTGETYSKECIEGLLSIAKLKDQDFKILWDNAYSIHDFLPSPSLPNIFNLANEQGLDDCIISFASTSKITFAGAGVAFIAMSKANLNSFLLHYSSSVIGPDKINQLRHINFFTSYEDILRHMKKHALIVEPKFAIVEKWLSNTNLGSWTKPTGGYFVSFNARSGFAKDIIKLANDVGLKLTPAGATFPYGVDPKDENIRIAPTACSEEDLEKAMKVFTACLSLITLRNFS